MARFIGIELKSVKFEDSLFEDCYFEDIRSTDTYFENCTFRSTTFYKTGECSLCSLITAWSAKSPWLNSQACGSFWSQTCRRKVCPLFPQICTRGTLLTVRWTAPASSTPKSAAIWMSRRRTMSSFTWSAFWEVWLCFPGISSQRCSWIRSGELKWSVSQNIKFTANNVTFSVYHRTAAYSVSIPLLNSGFWLARGWWLVL